MIVELRVVVVDQVNVLKNTIIVVRIITRHPV